MLELDLSAEIHSLRTTFDNIREVVDVDGQRAEVAKLEERAADPDLWNDQENAQKVTSALSHHKAAIRKIESAASRLDDLEVMVDLANEMDDEDAATEARTELAALETTIQDLEVQTLLDGEYDERAAVVTIRAGAGGDD
ncbi:MAG: PCRF domain-containing protein, partial [Microbacterium gubbeenense]